MGKLLLFFDVGCLALIGSVRFGVSRLGSGVGLGGLRLRVTGLGILALDCTCRVQSSALHPEPAMGFSGFGSRHSGFGIRVSALVLRIRKLGFGFRLLPP